MSNSFENGLDAAVDAAPDAGIAAQVVAGVIVAEEDLSSGEGCATGHGEREAEFPRRGILPEDTAASARSLGPAFGDGSVRFVSDTIDSDVSVDGGAREASTDGAGDAGSCMWLPAEGGRGGLIEGTFNDGFFGSFFDQAKDAVDKASGRGKGGGDAGDSVSLFGKQPADEFSDLRAEKGGGAEKAALEQQATLLKGVFDDLSNLGLGKDRFEDQAFGVFGGRSAGEKSGAPAKDVAFGKDAPAPEPDVGTDLGDDKQPSSFDLFG